MKKYEYESRDNFGELGVYEARFLLIVCCISRMIGMTCVGIVILVEFQEIS